MRVLVACEFSGAVRNAFRARGHDAWSCDLQAAEDHSSYHYQGDVRDMFTQSWDLLIAHPPCTYLANSGVRWLHTEPGRWQQMRTAAAFFNLMLTAPVKRIAVENPIMHKHARGLIRANYTQIVQPWQFGHGETKATCLWLKNLPALKPTQYVSGRVPRVHMEAPGPERANNRSRTYQGIADAMAAQWSIETPLQLDMFNLLAVAA